MGQAPRATGQVAVLPRKIETGRPPNPSKGVSVEDERAAGAEEATHTDRGMLSLKYTSIYFSAQPGDHYNVSHFNSKSRLRAMN
jgi:hypothetical protein